MCSSMNVILFFYVFKTSRLHWFKMFESKIPFLGLIWRLHIVVLNGAYFVYLICGGSFPNEIFCISYIWWNHYQWNILYIRYVVGPFLIICFVYKICGWPLSNNLFCIRYVVGPFLRIYFCIRYVCGFLRNEIFCIWDIWWGPFPMRYFVYKICSGPLPNEMFMKL